MSLIRLFPVLLLMSGCITDEAASGVRSANATATDDAVVSALTRTPTPDLDMVMPGVHCVSNGSSVYVYNAGWIRSLAGTGFMCPLPLHIGDRVKAVGFDVIGDGLVDLTAFVYLNAGTSSTNITLDGVPVFASDVPPQLTAIAIDTVDTALGADSSVFIQVNPNAANLQLGQIRITYDHPQ